VTEKEGGGCGLEGAIDEIKLVRNNKLEGQGVGGAVRFKQQVKNVRLRKKTYTKGKSKKPGGKKRRKER